ncbi:o-succinylbenzoate--CoA ligase [Vibrio sp. F74]|uniref:o-succinylbenzoate--CoA ligase n=1 Tax=Vibrio sp. F74 TaxID=700020 RepID=UPI0035F583DF
MNNQLENSVQNWLSRWSEREPDKCALVFENNTYSWAHLRSLLNGVTVSLRGQNIGQGDVVALVSKNSMELVLAYLACIHLGALPALIAPSTNTPLVQKLDTLGCNHVWFGKGTNKLVDKASLSALYSFLPISIGCCVESDSATPANVHPDNLVSIVFTSGSTGAPKAVAHTNKQHEASAHGLLARFGFKPNDTWLLSLPMYHVSGLAIIWRWLTVGACLKIGGGKDLFTDLQGATHASLVPTQLKRLIDSGKRITLSRVLLGGSHIPLALAQEANRRGIDTWLGYGMTESASTVMAKQVDEHLGVGYLLPNRLLKVEKQRIYVGGETLASGYFYRGKLTPIVNNDWFDSKDLGEWEGDQLRILGRVDNLFISGGENIHCEEIEFVLTQHAKINNAVVLPVQDQEYGARPVAIIQCEHALEKKEVEQFLSQRLEKFKWPVEYIAMPETLLEGPSIKLSRAKVKAWFISSQVSRKKAI